MKPFELRRRFMRDSSSVRLGTIASDLFRLSSLVRSSSFDAPVFQGVLTEVKFFTEWASSEMDLQRQKKILSLQRTLVDWAPERMSEEKLHKIQKDAKKWSHAILKISGLLKKS